MVDAQETEAQQLIRLAEEETAAEERLGPNRPMKDLLKATAIWKPEYPEIANSIYTVPNQINDEVPKWVKDYDMELKSLINFAQYNGPYRVIVYNGQSLANPKNFDRTSFAVLGRKCGKPEGIFVKTKKDDKYLNKVYFVHYIFIYLLI